jgi:Putative stage IV sporulation protein YqfD.
MSPFRESVCFEIKGGQVERFLNIAMRRGLNLFNLKHIGESAYAFAPAEDFPGLSAAASKAGVELEVISRYGIPYYLRNYTKRLGFFTGFGLFCVTLWFLSLFIWNVETVNLPEEYAVSVSDILYETGIREGVLCSSIDADMLEHELEEKLPMFDMIKISCMGCGARVQFSLSRPVKKQEEADWPCDLIASECGQIVSVTASKGTIFAKEGDIAVPGDVLVSGVFDSLSGSIVMVHASGSVTALVDRTFSETVNYRQVVQEPTGRTLTVSRIMVLGMEIPLFASLPKGHFKRTYEENKVTIFGFELPVTFRREKWQELCFTEKEFSEEECVRQAEARLEKDIQKADRIEIVSSERTVNLLDSGVRVTRYVTFLKEITEERPFQIERTPPSADGGHLTGESSHIS